MPGGAPFLGDLIDHIEGALVGSAPLGIPAPNPALGTGLGEDPAEAITLGNGLFLGRPLKSDDFLTDKEVVVRSPSSANANETRGRDVAMSNDTVVVEFSFLLPATQRADATNADHRAARNQAYKLDAQIRGAIMDPKIFDEVGFMPVWVRSNRRLALNSGKAGIAPYGEAQFIVTESTYRYKRTESLTGGHA
jgi:hypothetical protein